MPEVDSTSTEQDAVTMQADLSPADAGEAKEALVAALTAAQEAKTPLTIDVQGESFTPCAMQLLVSAKRSAEAASVEMKLSEQAGKILASVHAD